MTFEELQELNKPYLNALKRAAERKRALDKQEERILLKLKEIEELKNYYNIVIEENEKVIDNNYKN
jgi:hypothetical protein